jgi:hypothetical protein
MTTFMFKFLVRYSDAQAEADGGDDEAPLVRRPPGRGER